MFEKRKSLTPIVILIGVAICVGFVWVGIYFHDKLSEPEVTTDFPLQGTQEKSKPIHPFIELLKLVVAAVIGITVTSVHKTGQRDKPLSRSLEQAQILLCVCGAVMMIIIGSSIPRALGIAGAAGLIRFRTPVKDPKDSIILILLLGLGMACGRGAFAVAGLGAIFVCIFLLILDRFGEAKPKSMLLELVSSGGAMPLAHVQQVFAQNHLIIEPREVTQGETTIMKYQVTADPATSLENVSSQLLKDGTAGIKSVVWQSAKKAGVGT